jgi:hypothetical protein
MGSLKSIFETMIQPTRGTFSPEHAEYILSLHFSREQHARYDALSQKASGGKLRVSERAELEDMLTANAILSILHSKARISLRKRNTAA